MSHDTSRKGFLAKVLGLAASGSLAPGSLARAVGPESAQKPAAGASFRLRPQARAVARVDSPA